MSRTWEAVAPIFPISSLPNKIHRIGPDVYLDALPSWFERDRDLLTTNFGMAWESSPAKACLKTAFKANGLGELSTRLPGEPRQNVEVAVDLIQIAMMSLWLAKPSGLHATAVITGEPELSRAPSASTSQMLHRIVPQESYADNRLSAADLAVADELATSLQLLTRSGPVWTAVRMLCVALVDSIWESRYLTLWVAIEALLGPWNPRRIAHKISKRLANLLNTQQEEAEECYRIVYGGYRMRSQIVHGKRPALSSNQADDLMLKAETIVRTALMKILRCPETIKKFTAATKDNFLDNLNNLIRRSPSFILNTSPPSWIPMQHALPASAQSAGVLLTMPTSSIRIGSQSPTKQLTGRVRRRLANRWCGLVKALKTTASQNGVAVRASALLNADRLEYEAFLSELADIWPERFSPTDIRRRADKVLYESAIADIGVATHEKFDTLLRSLEEYSDRKLCVVPIEGIQLENDDPVSIGPFRILKVQPTDIDRYAGLFETSIMRNTYYAVEERAKLADGEKGRIKSLIEGSVVAELELIAEIDRAYELLMTRAQALTDILQAMTTVVSFCKEARVTLGGHRHTGSHSAFVLPLNPGSWLQPNILVGAIGTLPLNKEFWIKGEETGLVPLATALGREQSPLETCIFRGIRWFAASTYGEHEGEELLDLVICVEAALGLPRSSSDVAIEFVIALAGPPPPSHQRRVREILRAAYRARNQVAHAGTTRPDFGDLKFIRYVIRNFLTGLIRLSAELRTPEEVFERVRGSASP